MLDSGDLASMAVAIVMAIGGYAANRATSKASVANTRVTAEEEAFVRARKFDLDTIERQDDEITELRESNRLKEEELKLLRPLVAEVDFLRRRVTRLETALSSHEKDPPNDEHDRHNPTPR